MVLESVKLSKHAKVFKRWRLLPPGYLVNQLRPEAQKLLMGLMGLGPEERKHFYWGQIRYVFTHSL
jgi:hypothetical protein